VGVVVCECVRVGEQEQERQGDCVSVCGWVFGLVVFVALVSNEHNKVTHHFLLH